MTIDEAIAKYKEITNTDAICPAHCNMSCDKCVHESKQIIEWLEELKAYREIGTVEGYKSAIECYTEEYLLRKSNKQYNKALDDFANILKENYDYLPQIFTKEAFVRYIDECAERLKAGVED